MSKVLKDIILSLIIITIININSLVQASDECQLYIGEATKYKNSNNVTINIYMKGINKKLTALGVDVKYDSSKLLFISSKSGQDLNATVKLAENIIEDSRVSIGAISVNGFKKDGLYYSIIFQVLDSSQDIPIQLSLREATDKDGNGINIKTIDGNIKISNEMKEIEKSPSNQKIQEFKISGKKEYKNLDTYIKKEGNIEVLGDDILVYEIENNKIIEIQDDGTIIPAKDGKTNVRVRLNGEIIGNVNIEIKKGNIKKIIATGENKDFKISSSTQDVELLEKNEELEEQIVKETVAKKNNELSNLQNRKNYVVIFIIGLMLVAIIYILFKLKRRRRKK